MSNSYLTNTVITREAARILHQTDNFLGSVNMSYEDQFAKAGAKVGSTIGMRLPSKYKARKTATFAGQDHVERSTPLAVLSQWGVDVSFSTYDRTMSLDDFSKRVVQPAIKQLAAEIAGQCMGDAYKLGFEQGLYTMGSLISATQAPRTSQLLRATDAFMECLLAHDHGWSSDGGDTESPATTGT